MKYYNRNRVLLRVGDNILLNGRYYQITDAQYSQFLKEYGPLNDGQTGTKTRVSELEPKDYNALVYVISGVFGNTITRKSMFKTANATRGSSNSGLAADGTETITDSPDFAFFSPQQQPLSLTPNGNTQGIINVHNSPIDDPDETMGVWLMHDDEIYIQASNNMGNNDGTQAATMQHFCYFYTLAPLSQKPPVFTPIPYHASRLSPTLKDFVA